MPREVFLTYIAPVHYNGIRRAPVSAWIAPPEGVAFENIQSSDERSLSSVDHTFVLLKLSCGVLTGADVTV